MPLDNSYIAVLDDSNIVINVIIGDKDFADSHLPKWQFTYTDGTKGNYAGIGFSYLKSEDIFMPAKCHAEAILDAENAKWVCDNPEHNVNKIGA
jgi:hypothetical protein